MVWSRKMAVIRPASSRMKEDASEIIEENNGGIDNGGEGPSEEGRERRMDPALWAKLPEDLLFRILSRMPVSAILRGQSVCRDWGRVLCSPSFITLYSEATRSGPVEPWLFVCSSYNCRQSCTVYDPSSGRWRSLPLSFLPAHMRFPFASVGGLLFFRGALATSSVCLTVCNPVTRSWRHLPPMTHARLNSLVCVIEAENLQTKMDPPYRMGFKIIVAGGTSVCGGDYECTTEVYDSVADSWQVTGTVPREYTVKITVWTSKTVYCGGVLYCLTSARPYNITAYDMVKATWRELRIPQPDNLFCSFLLQRGGRLVLVGAVVGADDRACQRVLVWELKAEGTKWAEIERMPEPYSRSFFQGRPNMDFKCVGSGDLLYFFIDSHSKVLVCDLSRSCSHTGWRWLPNWPLSEHFIKFSVRGLFLEPRLNASIY